METPVTDITDFVSGRVAEDYNAGLFVVRNFIKHDSKGLAFEFVEEFYTLKDGVVFSITGPNGDILEKTDLSPLSLVAHAVRIGDYDPAKFYPATSQVVEYDDLQHFLFMRPVIYQPDIDRLKEVERRLSIFISNLGLSTNTNIALYRKWLGDGLPGIRNELADIIASVNTHLPPHLRPDPDFPVAIALQRRARHPKLFSFATAINRALSRLPLPTWLRITYFASDKI